MMFFKDLFFLLQPRDSAVVEGVVATSIVSERTTQTLLPTENTQASVQTIISTTTAPLPSSAATSSIPPTTTETPTSALITSLTSTSTSTSSSSTLQSLSAASDSGGTATPTAGADSSGSFSSKSTFKYIIAGSVTSAFALTIITVMIWLCLRRRRREKKAIAQSTPFGFESKDDFSPPSTSAAKREENVDVFAQFGGRYDRTSAPTSPQGQTRSLRTLEEELYDGPIPDPEKRDQYEAPPAHHHPAYHPLPGTSADRPAYNPRGPAFTPLTSLPPQINELDSTPVICEMDASEPLSPIQNIYNPFEPKSSAGGRSSFYAEAKATPLLSSGKGLRSSLSKGSLSKEVDYKRNNSIASSVYTIPISLAIDDKHAASPSSATKNQPVLVPKPLSYIPSAYATAVQQRNKSPTPPLPPLSPSKFSPPLPLAQRRMPVSLRKPVSKPGMTSPTRGVEERYQQEVEGEEEDDGELAPQTPAPAYSPPMPSNAKMFAAFNSGDEKDGSLGEGGQAQPQPQQLQSPSQGHGGQEARRHVMSWSEYDERGTRGAMELP